MTCPREFIVGRVFAEPEPELQPRRVTTHVHPCPARGGKRTSYLTPPVRTEAGGDRGPVLLPRPLSFSPIRVETDVQGGSFISTLPFWDVLGRDDSGVDGPQGTSVHLFMGSGSLSSCVSGPRVGLPTLGSSPSVFGAQSGPSGDRTTLVPGSGETRSQRGTRSGISSIRETGLSTKRQ